jgi:hypothetical protein
MTDAIRSNPVNLTQQSAVRDGGEEKGSSCSGDNYRKEGNNGCKSRGSRSIFLPDSKISGGIIGQVRQKKVYQTQISRQHKNPQC